MRFALLFFAAFGIFVGVNLIFISSIDLMSFCGKSCGITRALIEIFGNKSASLLIGILWLVAGIYFAWLAIARGKSKED